MKSRVLPNNLLIASTCVLLAASAVTIQAATYDKAEVTRIHNQVNVTRSDNVSRPAKVGEEVNRISSVTTGDASRAELRFPDKSLTRLGANSRFTLREGARTIDLEEGVMLLQVPKRIGGAKVRTAAVTAAVTGTTVLFEYLPNGYIKLIVVEGEVDLYLNNKPSHFRTVKAGEMIIMPANGTSIPEPVEIDLERLLKTSKLISNDEEWLPNYKEIQDAVQQQQKQLKNGELVGTNIFLPGRGTTVAIESHTPLQILTPTPQNEPQNPSTNGNNNSGSRNNNGSPDTPPPPPSSGGGSLSRSDGTSVLNNTSKIITNPHVIAFNSIHGLNHTSEGAIYDGSEPFPMFGFGSNTSLDLDPQNPVVDNHLRNRTWAAFRFEELIINGSPIFEIVGTPNVILSADGDVLIDTDQRYGSTAGGVGETLLDLDGSGVENLTLYSQNGNVTLGENFSIYAPGVNLALIAAGPSSDINILNNIDLQYSFLTFGAGEFETGKLLLSAGRDINISSPEDEMTTIYTYQGVNVNSLDAQAGRDINVKKSAVVNAQDSMKLTARRHINITNSSILKVLSSSPEALAKLETLQGDINLTGDNEYNKVQLQANQIELLAQQGNINIHNAIISSDVFKAETMGANGWINIGNNSSLTAQQIMTLYAAGAQGGIRFSGKVTLDSPSIHIAGKTVEITEGSYVYLIKGPNGVKVYTDTPQFRNGADNHHKGSFIYGENQVDVHVETFKKP